MSDDRDAVAALRLATALGPWWAARGNYSEGIAALSGAIARAGEVASVVQRQGALVGLGSMHVRRGDKVAIRSSAEAGLALQQEDERPELSAQLMTQLAYSMSHEPEKALNWADRSVELARQAQKEAVLADALTERSGYRLVLNLPGSIDDDEEALGLYRHLGDSFGVSKVLTNLGYRHLIRGDAAQARMCMDEALEIAQNLRTPSLMLVLWLNHGIASVLDGDLLAARRSYSDALLAALDLEDLGSVPYALLGLALCRSGEGDDTIAAMLVSAADRRLEELGQSFEPLEAGIGGPFREDLKSRLGAESFDAAAVHGRALSDDQLSALALGEKGE
jgi:tetratricopeptide (TPR) repeat protein